MSSPTPSHASGAPEDRSAATPMPGNPPSAPTAGFAAPTAGFATGFGPPPPPTPTSAPFAAPYAAAPVGPFVSPAPAPRRRSLGAIAVVLAIVAGVLASAVAGFASFRAARGADWQVAADSAGGFDWRALSPVRDLVLVAEIAFWSGTVLGIAALAVGIVAIARRRGRGAGIGAVVIAALGPVIFVVLVVAAVTVGAGDAAVSSGLTI